MATAPNQLEGIAQLASLLGGNKTTTNAGNTDPLQQVLAQLQGTDYNAMLQSIFQQAGGAIPGLQAAYGNAIGARSGGNSAVQAALNKLMSQTTLAGQQQLATQQNQNMQTQGQAAANIAQATKGTTTKEGTDLSQVAKSLAIMKLLSETGVFKAAGLGTQDAATTGSAPTPADMTGFSTPTASPTYFPSANAQQGTGDLFSSVLTSPDYTAPVASMGTDISNMIFPQQEAQPNYDMTYYDNGLSGGTPDFGTDYSPVAGDAYMPAYDADAQFELDWADATEYRDGGMVKKNANDYADGGIVTQQARGGRRSSAADVQTTAPRTSLANNTGGLNTIDIGALMAPSSVGEVESARTALSSPTSMGTLQGVGGSGNGNLSFRGTDNNINPSTLNAINQANRINSLSGLTGGPSIPGLGGIMGLVNAKSPEQALTAAGTTALGMASPQLASIAKFAMDPSKAKAVDIATSFVPGVNVLNAALGLGGTSFGTIAFGSDQKVDPKTGAVTEARNGIWGPDRAISSPVSGFGEVETTDLSYVGTPATSPFSPSDGLSSAGNQGNGVTTSPVTGFGKITTTNLGPAVNSSRGGGSSGGYSGGGSSASTGGGPSSPSSGSTGSSHFGANGGPISGPGTGTSDSIKANLSDGEFVMSADVVEALGEDFFDQLQAAFHTPVAQRRAA